MSASLDHMLFHLSASKAFFPDSLSKMILQKILKVSRLSDASPIAALAKSLFWPQL